MPDGGISRLRAWGVPDTSPPPDPSGLVAHLNGLSDAGARGALLRCCGSLRWVEAMMEARPFQSRVQLFGEAARIWWGLGDGDWLEAFGHHPKIGADPAELRRRFAATSTLAAGEQAGVQGASAEVLEALRAGNTAYETRFGFIFIVCASGLSAEAMLDRLDERIDNDPAAELRLAAGEQAKITALRLARLL